MSLVAAHGLSSQQLILVPAMPSADRGQLTGPVNCSATPPSPCAFPRGKGFRGILGWAFRVLVILIPFLLLCKSPLVKPPAKRRDLSDVATEMKMEGEAAPGGAWPRAEVCGGGWPKSEGGEQTPVVSYSGLGFGRLWGAPGWGQAEQRAPASWESTLCSCGLI